MSLRGFDWEYYIEKYPDLAKGGIDNKRKAILHYQKYGEKENRYPNKNIEIRQKKLNKKKFYKVNKSFSSKDESDIMSNNYDPELSDKINSLNTNVIRLNKEIVDIKKNIQKMNNNFNNLFSNIKNLINNNSNNLNNNSSKISIENTISKISNSNISKKIVSRIESSEDYDLNDNLSENVESEEESEIDNNDVIVKYSNSEENNLNDNSLDESIENLIQSSDSFSKNLSYEK